jgi:nicotinate-nucleotide adenylyltransferase
MRLGIFGGTFDPVHLGHLIMAEQCREQASLDQVWFMASAQPPHKRRRHLTPFDHRRDMLELAVAGHAAFRVSTLEQELGGLSYTVRTLAEIHRRQPADDLFLVLGSDCLDDLPGWREPAGIVARATLLVVARPGFALWPKPQLQEALHLGADVPLRQQTVDVPLIDIASRDLRRRVSLGRSIRFMVPRAVECYIQQHELYRDREE